MDNQAEGSKIAMKNQPDHPVQASGHFLEIRIKGQLSSNWAEWLEGLEMTCLEDGEMALSGTLADQAALLGVLAKLHRLNLTILSVNKLDRGNKTPLKS